MNQRQSFARYAIFWLPPADGALAAFGRDWFGTCPERGETRTPAGFGLPETLAAKAIERPRRYTLHGTIVAPFRPAKGITAQILADELCVFCARRTARTTRPLRISRLSRHLSLIPDSGTARLDWLATEAVTHFNTFRAPMSESDLARYPAEQHSDRQVENVHAFGYPYVLSDFIFHITLAGPLEAEQLDEVEQSLAPHLESLTDAPLQIGSLCLLGEVDQTTPFRLIARCALAA